VITVALIACVDDGQVTNFGVLPSLGEGMTWTCV
jgi:hypothetical protein